MARLRDTLRSLSLLLCGSETQRATAFWHFFLTDADARSIELLVHCLSPAQREQYEAHRYFTVTGGDTGATYRIRQGYQMNVDRLDEKDRRVGKLCFMPKDGLPVGDVMLAQKIESEAIMVANKSVGWYLE
jgi:hypothetical protein